jgi:hypothetical protein
MLSAFSLDFTDCAMAQPVSFACTLLLTDALTGMSDATTVVIHKEVTVAERPPRGRGRNAAAGAAGGAVPMAPVQRRTAVGTSPAAPPARRPPSSGSNEMSRPPSLLSPDDPERRISTCTPGNETPRAAPAEARAAADPVLVVEHVGDSAPHDGNADTEPASPVHVTDVQ